MIEIEQHGGTLRDGAEQVTKLSQRIGADDVPVVRRQEDAVEPLAGEHAEVVLPEIRHHFRKLPVARHRARELGGLQVTEHALVLPELVAQLRIGLEDFGTEVLLATRVALARQLLLLLTDRLLTILVHRHEFGCRPPEHFVRCHDPIGDTVIDAVRRQLEANPLIHAHRAYLGSIPRSRAKRQAVQHLLHLLVSRLLARFRGGDHHEGSRRPS